MILQVLYILQRHPITSDPPLSLTKELGVCCYCWWFRNPVNSPVEDRENLPLFTGSFIHLRWCRNSEPSTVLKRFGKLFQPKSKIARFIGSTVPSTEDSSHHQDHYIFRLGNPENSYKPLLATVPRSGVDPTDFPFRWRWLDAFSFSSLNNCILPFDLSGLSIETYQQAMEKLRSQAKKQTMYSKRETRKTSTS